MMAKILVVEDDEGIAHLLRRLMTKKGHETILASNGWDGLIQAQTQMPDLIFTDVRMPDLGGLELATFIKADPLLKHIPLIILSGTAYLLEADSTLADEILAKPFEINTVYGILERFLPQATHC